MTAFQQLRLEIVRSLVNYPLEQAKPLYERALVSGNEETRQFAQKVLSGRRDV
jgi:hypothetical protein